jgi:glycerol-3-phosphate O-acyltransferase
MLRRFGWFYHLIGLGRALGRLRIEEHSVEQIRRAADAGPIVYALPTRSAVDHLALNTALTQRRLPLSVWADGARSFYWQPVAEAWSDVAWRLRSFFTEGFAPDPVRSGWVQRSVVDGHPVTLFVEGSPTWLDSLRSRERSDPLAAVLAAQRELDTPISIVPALVVWDRAPEHESNAVRRFFQVGRPVTGMLQGLVNAWLRSSQAFIQVGEPLDLRRITRRMPIGDDRRALRKLLAVAMRRETNMVRGPRLSPHREFRKVVLDNPPMRQLVREEARVANTTEDHIRRKMVRDYDAIAARFKWRVIVLLSWVLRPLWTRVFSGVDVTTTDLERIRTAMRNGTAVLVPSHKSHLDYVLLSWVFFKHDLIVPHIVAGMNLAIWPLSLVLRGAGAFFVKRKFADDRIFPAVFNRYLRELIFRGYPVEFFIEGGRTRSGKLMPPRVGVLGMVLGACELGPKDHEVTVLPIALAYEQVAEESSYARELGGEVKRPESLGQFFRASSVFRRRFGRVYLRVGEPLPVRPEVASEGRKVWSQRSTKVQKVDLHIFGERILHHIGDVTVVLPSSLVALALLAHHRRGLKHGLLVDRVERFRARLHDAGAPEAQSVEHLGQAVAQALDRFLKGKLVEAFEHEGERVWATAPDRRITLDFYKNQVLHYLAPAGYACLAMRALPARPVTVDELRPVYAQLLWTFRNEFILDPDRSATRHLLDGLATLQKHGAVVESEGAWAVRDSSRMGEFYGLFRSLPEGYAAVLEASSRLSRRTLSSRDLARAIQSDRDALMAAGRVSRPESLSLVPLQNAVRAFTDEGVFHKGTDGRLSVDAAACERRFEDLSPLVFT